METFHLGFLIHSRSHWVRLDHSSHHKLPQELSDYWVLASGIPALHLLFLYNQHMVSTLRFPCLGILAAQRIRWPPRCAGRRNSERIWSKSGKMDGDLEPPKNHPGPSFRLVCLQGAGWILAVRLFWNAIGLINMVTSYHRGSPLSGTRCSHVHLKIFGRFWQLLSLFSCSLIITLEHFNFP